MIVDTKFSEKQLGVLVLYEELTLTKFSKFKKEIYAEIQKQTKQNKNTIISWIRRYYEVYKKIKQEIIEEKNATICNFEGLTKKQTLYVIARMNGYSKEQAKIQAGYSPLTKAANIEKNHKVATKLAELRETLFNDTRLGVLTNLNALATIRDRGIQGVEIVEYTDESSPDGHTIRKVARREYPAMAGVAAAKEINNILGYKYTDELKAEKQKEENEETILID